MNLQELTSPIRMYWDIGSPPAVSVEDIRRIAGEIAAAKFLTLQITETASSLSPSCLAALDALKDKPLALSLVARLAVLDGRAGELLRPFPIRVLFAEVSSLDDLGRVAELKPARAGAQAGLSFPVSRENFRELPRLLAACIGRKIPHLLLPMQRLIGGEACFVLSRSEREALTAELRAIAKPAWLKITIHDPFLWRAFYPETEFPNGGCQAANTMLYLSPEARVYPCPLVPLLLGDLRKELLKDVLFSEGKKRARKELLAAAPPCADCAEWDSCKGGCRGRALAMQRTLLQNDPACR